MAYILLGALFLAARVLTNLSVCPRPSPLILLLMFLITII